VKKKILTLIGLIIALALGFYVWQAFHFRQTGTYPSLSQIATLTPYIDINFNKPASANDLSITDSSKIVRSNNISGKSLRLSLRHLAKDQTYTIIIDRVQDKNGRSLNNLRFSFTARDIPFNKLSKDQQKAVVNSQDPNDPALLTNDPLVAHLPYGDIGYNISYVIETKNNKPSLLIEIGVILAGSDYKLSRPALQDAINQREQAAINYIKSLGLDPAKYNIQYSVPPY